MHVVDEVSQKAMKSRSREERTDGCDAISEVVRVILIGEAVVVSSAFGFKVR